MAKVKELAIWLSTRIWTPYLRSDGTVWYSLNDGSNMEIAEEASRAFNIPNDADLRIAVQHIKDKPKYFGPFSRKGE